MNPSMDSCYFLGMNTKTKRDNKRYSPPKPEREPVPLDETQAMIWETRKKSRKK